MKTTYDVFLQNKKRGTFYERNIALTMAAVYRRKGYSVQIVKREYNFDDLEERVNSTIIYNSEEYESILDKREAYLLRNLFI